MASAVAIDVAIVATHLKIEIKTFLVTFILLFLFTYGFYGLYGFFTLHYSLLPYLVSFARYGRAALVTALVTALGVITTA